jgi:polyisoprenoid-binding protein YceI
MKKIAANFLNKITLTIFFILLNSNLAFASYYQFDKEYSDISWSVNLLGFNNFTGKFTDYSGEIFIDEKNPQNSSVKVVIKTDSILTSSDTIDNLLKGKSFFDVTKYTEIKFESNFVQVVGRLIKIKGTLYLHGEKKDIELVGRFNKAGFNKLNQKKTAGFSFATEIKRSDFGIKSLIPEVSDLVKIKIEVQANLTDDKRADSELSDKTKLIDESLFDVNSLIINQQSGRINFLAKKAGKPINGNFSKFEGKLKFDQNDISKSAVSIDVDLSSISIRNSEILSTIFSYDWFDIKNHLYANFTAKEFSKTAISNQIKAIGTMNIKGRKANVEFIFSVSNYTDTSVNAMGKFVIKRSDFDVGNKIPKLAFDVEDEVEISFNILATKI